MIDSSCIHVWSKQSNSHQLVHHLTATRGETSSETDGYQFAQTKDATIAAKIRLDNSRHSHCSRNELRLNVHHLPLVSFRAHVADQSQITNKKSNWTLKFRERQTIYRANFSRPSVDIRAGGAIWPFIASSFINSQNRLFPFLIIFNQQISSDWTNIPSWIRTDRHFAE